MAALDRSPSPSSSLSSLVVVGGPAADDEVLSCVARAVRESSGAALAVGRGNVAGALGHRYAVAYGLVLGLSEAG
jgi:Diol dehydratase reactivase ATPase-like domain